MSLEVTTPALGFEVPAGSLVAVVGAAASGKSSLLLMLAGRVASTAVVRLHGFGPDDPALRGRIALVARDHELLPTLTAVENVDLAALGDGVSPEAAWRHSCALLDELGLPPAAQANLAEELSGGQHQRVAVARSLAGAPALVLADDPTSELDAASTARVVTALRSASRTGAVVVVSTSEPTLAAAASLVVDLDAGDVRAQHAEPPPSHPYVVGIDQDARAGNDFTAGDRVDIVGRAVDGWLRVAAADGLLPRSHVGGSTMLLPWNTARLATRAGETVEVMRIDHRTGWSTCRAVDGRTGLVPTSALEAIDEPER